MLLVISLDLTSKLAVLLEIYKDKEVVKRAVRIALLKDFSINFPKGFLSQREMSGIQNKTSHPIKFQYCPLVAEKQKTTTGLPWPS